MLRKRGRIEFESDELAPGTFVWAQLKANDWWPGLVIDSEDVGLPPPKTERLRVFWFGDYRISEVSIKNICDFKEYFSLCFKGRKNVPEHWSKGVAEAIMELGFPHTTNWKEPRLLRWALDQFPSGNFNFSFEKRIPQFVAKRLAEIKAMNSNSISEQKHSPLPTAKGSTDTFPLENDSGETSRGTPQEQSLVNGESNLETHEII